MLYNSAPFTYDVVLHQGVEQRLAARQCVSHRPDHSWRARDLRKLLAVPLLPGKGDEHAGPAGGAGRCKHHQDHVRGEGLPVKGAGGRGGGAGSC